MSECVCVCVYVCVSVCVRARAAGGRAGGWAGGRAGGRTSERASVVRLRGGNYFALLLTLQHPPLLLLLLLPPLPPLPPLLVPPSPLLPPPPLLLPPPLPLWRCWQAPLTAAAMEEAFPDRAEAVGAITARLQVRASGQATPLSHTITHSLFIPRHRRYIGGPFLTPARAFAFAFLLRSP